MDWVILDVPCSGTGTIRRNPDIKWKFTNNILTSLIDEQRKIFSEALNFLKNDGNIVYITCSILKEENEKQVNYFLENYPVFLALPPMGWLPKRNGMDGFFAAVFRKKT